VDAVKPPWVRRRARRQLAIIQARQALVSLPDISWRDAQSEEQARQRLHDVAATVTRALRWVRASSDEARALKYAQTWLTTWLQGWGDPDLIPTANAASMYERLVSAMRTISIRLKQEGETGPSEEPEEPVPRS
jgi:type VI protein secretion system component VasF